MEKCSDLLDYVMIYWIM